MPHVTSVGGSVSVYSKEMFQGIVSGGQKEN